MSLTTPLTTPIQQHRIARSIAVVNGKGGVGKTSVAASLGAHFASHGRPTTVVDLDPQGHLAADLGVDGDEGQTLSAAVQFDQPLRPVPSGRDDLSVVPGGEHLTGLAAALRTRANIDAARAQLAHALRPLVDNGHWIILDTPPAAESMFADAAIAIAEGIVVPTRVDARSLDGIATLLTRVLDVAPVWGAVRPLGVVLVDVASNATALKQGARDDLADLGAAGWPILDTTIRSADRAVADCRANGLVPAEYAALATQASTSYWADRAAGRDHIAFASNAAGIASDYAALGHYIMEATNG